MTRFTTKVKASVEESKGGNASHTKPLGRRATSLTNFNSQKNSGAALQFAPGAKSTTGGRASSQRRVSASTMRDGAGPKQGLKQGLKKVEEEVEREPVKFEINNDYVMRSAQFNSSYTNEEMVGLKITDVHFEYPADEVIKPSDAKFIINEVFGNDHHRLENLYFESFKVLEDGNYLASDQYNADLFKAITHSDKSSKKNVCDAVQINTTLSSIYPVETCQAIA